MATVVVPDLSDADYKKLVSKALTRVRRPAGFHETHRLTSNVYIAERRYVDGDGL